MSIEERFGVAITDAEAEACFTPAAVIDLVLGKLRSSDERVCVSQRAFFLLRRGLIRTSGVARQQVNLAVDVRLFAEGRSERELWEELKTAVRARHWPALVRPRWLAAGIWLLSLGTFCALTGRLGWVVAAPCAGGFGYVASWLTRPLCSRVPARYSRLRDLVPFAASSDAITWTRDQVAVLVRTLVIEQLGLEEAQYREDAHFVDDLGMN